jgi:hypothetical protein
MTYIDLTEETAATIAAPLLELLQHAPDDGPAEAVIVLVRAIAHEQNDEARRLFANDLANKVYAGSFACRDAALSFGEFAASGQPKTFAL